MKTILLATDFSKAADNAAEYATDMALAIQADLHLLHIFQLPVTYNEIPVAINSADMIKDAEKRLKELKENLNRKTKGNLKIETEVSEGIFYDELKAVCERINPYTVIMGSQGTTAAERLFFGSHALDAMKNLMWPLITVPKGAKFYSINKIGLACDFDEVADTTPFHEIKSLVRDFHAELHILNTGSKDADSSKLIHGSKVFKDMLAVVKPDFHFIENKNIDEGIVNFAEKNKIDLLIVLPKRHNLLEKLIHRSHTKQLVLHSHVPVMALHHQE